MQTTPADVLNRTRVLAGHRLALCQKLWSKTLQAVILDHAKVLAPNWSWDGAGFSHAGMCRPLPPDGCRVGEDRVGVND